MTEAHSSVLSDDLILDDLANDEVDRIRGVLRETRSGLVDVSGHRIGVLDVGEGIPFVLLHSIGLDRWAWLRVVPYLVRRRRVIALDLPGHGQDIGAEIGGFRRFSEIICSAANQLDLRGVHLCGLSMGGTLALDIALLGTKLVSRVTAIAAVADGFPALRDRAAAGLAVGIAAQIEATLERWFTAEERVSAAWQVRFAASRLQKMTRRGWADAWNALAEAALSTRLELMPCPASIIAGGADASIPPATMAAIAAKIPGARFAVVGEAPHQVALSKPAELAALLLKEEANG